ncbi:MAG TPA: hypothetical protein VN704_05820 [Verrucomicrobiae bacterium]|nr:hypothetical protein [Verrucomicrobiae bacterium]
MIQCHGEIIDKKHKEGKRCDKKSDFSFCKKHLDQQNEHETFVKRTKEYLTQISIAPQIENKVDIVEKMYAFILDNTLFLYKNPKFKDAAINKLNDLQLDWPKALKIKELLGHMMQHYAQNEKTNI